MNNAMALQLIEKVKREVVALIVAAGKDKDTLTFGRLTDCVMAVKVVLTGRRSKRAGTFKWVGQSDMGRVLINTALCHNEERFTSTLKHEISHGLTWWSGQWSGHRRSKHDWRWQAWQRVLGASTSATHDYDLVEAFGAYGLEAACANGHTLRFGPIQANKVKRRGHTDGFHCVACKRTSGKVVPVKLIQKGE